VAEVTSWGLGGWVYASARIVCDLSIKSQVGVWKLSREGLLDLLANFQHTAAQVPDTYSGSKTTVCAEAGNSAVGVF
jgi:hypothetical protein